MPFKDILLRLENYPDAMPLEAVDRAVRLAARLGDSVCGLTLRVHFPLKPNRMADLLIGLGDMARQEEQRCLNQAQAILERFRDQGRKAGLKPSELMVHCEYYNAAERIAVAARTRDLCLVPYVGDLDAQRGVAEAVIFGAGRPVVVFRADDQREIPERLDRILVAWDGGRAAARAVADALPILAAAQDVQIVIVTNEKPGAGAGSGDDLKRHLDRHGVAAQMVEIDAEGSPIGAVLRRRLAQDPRDLMVMGAFGHSRTREFILGGATQSLLSDPPAPIFFSH